MKRELMSAPAATPYLCIAVAALALLCGARAAAQNNSLFNPAAMRAAPTTQPSAVRTPSSLSAGMNLTARSGDATQAGKPPRNPVLLSVSPIAVAEPAPKKIGVGDFVTVIVREDKQALSDARLQADKEWTLDAEISKWFRLHDERDRGTRLIPQTFEENTTPGALGNPGAAFNFRDEYGGRGTVDRRDSLTTRIQARVIDVKPNGNLLLEATKDIQLNDDEGYKITLTGECRAADVTPQNSVLSTQVADAHIKVENRGAAKAASERGWFKKLSDKLKLF